jgi:nucleoside-diphosphate-sugar epimerase
MSAPAPGSVSELDDLLAQPTPGVLDTLARHPGDLLVLGAGGKMGPSLALMAWRALQRLGQGGRVIAVSRFTQTGLEQRLRGAGIVTHRADLLDPSALAALPDAANIIYMAGQKFGTHENPATTWAMNAVMPAFVTQRFAGLRTVVFSSGNVYPLTPVESGGPAEGDPVQPVGEYAMSCLARERVFEHSARSRRTPVLILRLNYAVELRYGVLVDIATRVLRGEPVPLAMGHVNLIWQGDANARAVQCLDLASSPATILNVTGPETLSVRWIAEQFGALFGRPPGFTGAEAPDALLSSAQRSVELFGAPTVRAETLIQWTAEWLRHGGPLLGKPTHFEERSGRF